MPPRRRTRVALLLLAAGSVAHGLDAVRGGNEDQAFSGLSASEEYLADLEEFTMWHTKWKADGSPKLVVDPKDVTKHVRG